jgi:hypothetical protein
VIYLAIAAASSYGVLATVFGHLLEATGHHNEAALLSMNPVRKSLILLEPVISSLRACCMANAYLGVDHEPQTSNLKPRHREERSDVAISGCLEL